jgi:hypothetical protein
MTTYDPDEIREQIAHQRSLIKNNERHIHHLEEQKSTFGLGVSSSILVQIEKYEQEIKKCENKIAKLRLPLIKPKQEELDAFKAMLQIISNPAASKWILTTIANTGALFLTRMVVIEGGLDDLQLYILEKQMRTLCMDHIARLEKEIAEIVNL